MQELDVLLQRYFKTSFPAAGAEEKRAFKKLLDQPDPQLAAWLIYGQPCPEQPLASLIQKIRALD